VNAKKRRRATKSVGRPTTSIGGKAWADLFASRTLAQLLTTFLTHPEKDFYQKELADTAEVAEQAA
jgi:hypothetical protein